MSRTASSLQTLLTIIRIRVYDEPMIVCVCKAVSERRIGLAVQQGAVCLRDLARDLGVGTCCGKCIPDARLALSAAVSARDAASAPAPFLRGAAPQPA